MKTCNALFTLSFSVLFASACSGDGADRSALSAGFVDSPAIDAPAQAAPQVRSAVVSDQAGLNQFEVQVLYGAEVREHDAQQLLSDIQIVPFEEAFPDLDSALRDGLPESALDVGRLEPDAIQVVLQPLDPETDARDFAWRLPVVEDDAPGTAGTAWTGAPGSERPQGELGQNAQAQVSSLAIAVRPRDTFKSSKFKCNLIALAFTPVFGSGKVCLEGPSDRCGNVQFPSVLALSVLTLERASWRFAAKAGSAGLSGVGVLTCN